MKRGICTRVCVQIPLFILYIWKRMSASKVSVRNFRQKILRKIYKKWRKIIELRDCQQPAVCDNICVGTFINV